VVPLSALAKRSGKAPSTELVARARIQEFQEKNPSAVEVEQEPTPRPVAARVEQVDGRARATVLVQAGDSLWAIAQKFGVGLEELCRWNGIRNPRRTKLQIGTEIVVYPRAAPPAAPQASAPSPG
jgi:membrane-bound lytic murein transglycosylase D